MPNLPNEPHRELLRRAAEKPALGGAANSAMLTPVEMQKLLHEMQIYQDKLEMQNNTLRDALAKKKELDEKIERSPFGTYVVDSQFRIAMMNAASQEGAFRNVRPVIGRDFAEAMHILWPEEVAAAIIASFRHTLETGEPYYSRDFINKRHDHASVESYEWELQPLLLPDGKNGVICYYYDSTKLRQAEAALRESEERHRFLAETMLQGVVHQDAGGATISMNPAAERILGKNREEFLGNTSVTVEHHCIRENGEPFPGMEHPAMVALKSGRPVQGVVMGVFNPKLDAYRWIDISAVPVFRPGDTRASEVYAVFEDITERKRVEEELRRGEDRLKLFIEHAPAALAMFDRTMRYLCVSRRWREDYGLGDRHLIGESHYDIFPEIPAIWKEAHRRGLAGEVLRVDADRFVRADGSVQWEKWEIRPWCDAQGQVAGIVIFTEEITARMEAEEKIRRLNEELEERVRERTAELESFCYSISHDLRAPLRSMSGFSGILQEDYTESLDDTGREYLRRIEGAAADMGQLIDNLLNLSRVSRSQLSHERVDLSQLAATIIKTLSQSEAKRGVDAFIQQGMETEGDPQFIAILLTNLFANAWKYTCKEPFPKVEFGKTLMDGKAVYFVKDNGVGFDMAHASQLYKPFHRLHRADEFEGHGIGLATAERIVSRHRGRIWAEGEVGKGATFYFTLSL